MYNGKDFLPFSRLPLYLMDSFHCWQVPFNFIRSHLSTIGLIFWVISWTFFVFLFLITELLCSQAGLRFVILQFLFWSTGITGMCATPDWDSISCLQSLRALLALAAYMSLRPPLLRECFLETEGFLYGLESVSQAYGRLPTCFHFPPSSPVFARVQEGLSL